MVTYSGLPLKKTQHMWLLHAKLMFVAMVCNSKLWHLISMKLDIGKKITGLETTNHEKIEHVFKLRTDVKGVNN